MAVIPSKKSPKSAVTPATPASVTPTRSIGLAQSPLSIGTQVFIRTVTFYYTGVVVGVSEFEVLLEQAAWVPSTGRWHETLAKGELEECEPYPDGVVSVGRSAIVDVCVWSHDLPRTAK